MRTGDIVKHHPTGETWLLGGADLERDEVYPLGWPPSIGKASDCTMKKACSDEEHWQQVATYAAKDNDTIWASHCRKLLRSRYECFSKSTQTTGT